MTEDARDRLIDQPGTRSASEAAQRLRRLGLDRKDLSDDEEAIKSRLEIVHFQRYSAYEWYRTLYKPNRASAHHRLIRSSRDLAEHLFRYGRALAAELVDERFSSFLREAQREFQFCISSGILDSDTKNECLGKYAVSVAILSRWQPQARSTLEGALKMHAESVDNGNDGPEALGYLAELNIALYESLNDERHLMGGLDAAQRADRPLLIAEIKLREAVSLMSLIRSKGIDRDRLQDDRKQLLDEARRQAKRRRPVKGVDWVRAALIPTFCDAVEHHDIDLPQSALSLPFGVVNAVATLREDDAMKLAHLVTKRMLQMRTELNKREARNLIAQKVLYGVLRGQVLRDQAPDDRTLNLLVRIAEETANYAKDDRTLRWQAADAAYIRAARIGTSGLSKTAVREAKKLLKLEPNWVPSRVTFALSLQEDLGPDASETLEAWKLAIETIETSPNYRRRSLGGRGSVYVVDDFMNLMSSDLVFKVNQQPLMASRESENIRRFKAEIDRAKLSDLYGVPEVLAIVETHEDGVLQTVLIMKRQPGTVLGKLPLRRQRQFAGPCLELLALYHSSSRLGTTGAGWNAVRVKVSLALRTLLLHDEVKQELKARLSALFPRDFPTVLKRDAHLGNWLVDNADRVIAVDLECNENLPVGYEVAQLIEDSGLLRTSPNGISERYRLLSTYLKSLRHPISIELEDVWYQYPYFALVRCLLIATSKDSTKRLHQHAREVIAWIASLERTDGLPALALDILEILNAQSVPSALERTKTREHIRLSTYMAKILRHDAISLGLNVSQQGFVALAELANVMSVEDGMIRTVATHPLEPRFHLDTETDRIRARYGHSFDVVPVDEVDVLIPDRLFHGTAWESLPSILELGVRPQNRQEVYLTNNPDEAIMVGRRHGPPVLLSVSSWTPSNELTIRDLHSTAPAVWGVKWVNPKHLVIENPFAFDNEEFNWAHVTQHE